MSKKLVVRNTSARYAVYSKLTAPKNGEEGHPVAVTETFGEAKQVANKYCEVTGQTMVVWYEENLRSGWACIDRNVYVRTGRNHEDSRRDAGRP